MSSTSNFSRQPETPQISVHSELADTLNLSEIKGVKTPVFENRLEKEASGEISLVFQRCCWQPVKSFGFAGTLPHCGGST